MPSRSRTDTCRGILYSLDEFSAEELTELLSDSREHLDERRATWNKPLVNKLSPGAALVTNSGQVVTFDDHANLGYGPNVIVVYDTTGNVVHRYSLKDLVSQETILCILHTTSSIWWRKSFWFENNDSTLAVELNQSNQWRLKCPDSDTIRVPLY
jgi:hypothetical protein